MGFNIIHNSLFEVKILHHYFLNKAGDVFDGLNADEKSRLLRNYDIGRIFTVTAAGDTAALMRNHRCNLRVNAGGIAMGVQTVKDKDDNTVPAIAFNSNARFTLLLNLSDPFFTNYTALPLQKKEGYSYFLQNRTAGAAKRFPYLSQFPVAFTAGTWSAGDIVSDNAANPAQLFIANRVTSAAPPGADWLADGLVGGQPLMYVTQADQVRVSGSFFRFPTGTDDILPAVTLTNRFGDTITPKFELFMENDRLTVLAKLQHLPEDLYTIQIKDIARAYDQSVEFYLLHSGAVPFMILDLSVNSNQAAYDMLGAAGQLLSAVYEMRFRNRLTRWRYMGKKFGNRPELGPHPLTKNGVIDLSAVDAEGKTVEDLPNADVKMLKTEFPLAGQKKYNTISEIYIH